MSTNDPSTSPLTAFAPRLLHAMLPVRDLEAMLGFYCGLLGMREIRRIDFPAERYSLVFIGYEAAPEAPQVEFRHDWEAGSAAPATARDGHLGIGVRDIEAAVATLAARGVPIRRPPGAMRPGGRVIALVEDPEGNEVELLACP
jgi:lactoylglutathione lyase